jgi:hypothetical protein
MSRKKSKKKIFWTILAYHLIRLLMMLVAENPVFQSNFFDLQIFQGRSLEQSVQIFLSKN